MVIVRKLSKNIRVANKNLVKIRKAKYCVISGELSKFIFEINIRLSVFLFESKNKKSRQNLQVRMYSRFFSQHIEKKLIEKHDWCY